MGWVDEICALFVFSATFWYEGSEGDYWYEPAISVVGPAVKGNPNYLCENGVVFGTFASWVEKHTSKESAFSAFCRIYGLCETLRLYSANIGYLELWAKYTAQLSFHSEMNLSWYLKAAWCINGNTVYDHFNKRSPHYCSYFPLDVLWTWNNCVKWHWYFSNYILNNNKFILQVEEWCKENLPAVAMLCIGERWRRGYGTR